MFSHVMLGANDLEYMIAFYDAVLSHAGLERTTPLRSVGPAGVIWKRGARRWPQFALRTPYNNKPALAGNGVQVGFSCNVKEAVEAARMMADPHIVRSTATISMLPMPMIPRATSFASYIAGNLLKSMRNRKVR